MTCLHPLTAYRLVGERTEKGKSLIVFQLSEVGEKTYIELQLPCGRCMGCRVKRSREWALRCVHEASLHDENCFVTLTFRDEDLEPTGSLVKSDFQKFMKRLRKRFSDVRIRYYHCGEYGEGLSRPHHHACIFGFDFPDKVLWRESDGVKLYRSAVLEELWPYGFCTVGDVTFESAAYVARYIMKKIGGDLAEDHYTRVNEETGEIHRVLAEYTTMSRRPGIGADWFEKYGETDLVNKDFCTVAGRKFKSPRYYDDLYDNVDPEGLAKLKYKRRKECEILDGARLSVVEKCLKSRLNKLERSL